MTNKEIARILPDIATMGDDLYLNFKGSSAVTDEAITHLLQAKNTLKSLNLTGTGVTEHGVYMLRKGLPNTQVILGEAQITPLSRAIADASLKAPIKPWERAAYQWVPPREIAETVFKSPH